jgi:sigma-54 dependent transcriptional regulator, acetoin dehydrogenase operon transcriptional activator AcoR
MVNSLILQTGGAPVTPQPGPALTLTAPMAGTAAWRRTLEAKHRLLESRDPREPSPCPRGVRPEIFLSWRRCILSGVDWADTRLPRDDDRPRPSRLIEAAQPVLDRLADQLSGMHAWAFLTDGDCRLITRVMGDPALAPQLDSRGALPGALFREDLVGTNGLGGAAQQRQPFIVAGSEHFREHESNVTTAAAPVRDPATKRLLGLLNINCRYEFTNALLLPFVTELARAIEGRLRPSWRAGEQDLFEEFTRVSADRSRAVVALGHEILIANAPARRLLGAADYELLRRWAGSAATTQQRGHRVELPLSCGPTVVRYRPVRQARHQPAAVMILTAATAPATASAAPCSARGAGRLRHQLARAHAARLPVLLTGERGTGKTTLARSLACGAAGRAPFAELDAAESGDMPGDWLARFRAVAGDPDATVVLRHLDLLDPSLAGPVARLLETGPARLVATAGEGARTRPGLACLLERLPVILDVPPLRERAADIPALVTAIIAERLPRAPRPCCTPEALAALLGRDWPGNLRELRQVVMTALARSMSCDITEDDLPGGRAWGRRLTKLERLERHALVTALRETGWDAAAAARDLGISRATIYRKLRSFGIRPPA